MTAVDAALAARPQHQTSQDRIFYSGMAILMGLTVFIGFAPTFYLRSWFESTPSPSSRFPSSK